MKKSQLARYLQVRACACEVPGTAPMAAIHQSLSDSCKGGGCFRLQRTQNQQRTMLAWTAEGAACFTLHKALHTPVVSSTPWPSWERIPEGPAQQWCKKKSMIHAHPINTAGGVHALVKVCWRKSTIPDTSFAQAVRSCVHAQHMTHKERDTMVVQPMQGCTRGPS